MIPRVLQTVASKAPRLIIQRQKKPLARPLIRGLSSMPPPTTTEVSQSTRDKLAQSIQEYEPKEDDEDVGFRR